MITSTLGRSSPGSGSLRLAHHSSHSGTSMIASIRHTAYSGTNTCHAVVRLAGSDRSAYITTSRATADSSAHQVTMLSQGQRRRVIGSTVALGSAKLVNVRRMMTSPPTNRFTRVASMPKGPTISLVATPTVIISAWVSTDIAT